MGESISWFAVRGLARDRVYKRTGLSPTGGTGDYARGNIGAHPLPDGWFLIVLGKVEHPLVAESQLKSTSTGCEVVACNVEEHVMFSSSELWRNSERVWRVKHSSEISIFDLEADGDLPSRFGFLKREYSGRQTLEGGAEAGVDYMFDVPLDLAASIAPFKHDRTDLVDFELLDWRKPKQSWSLWRSWKKS
jgi:hypothetical protein